MSNRHCDNCYYNNLCQSDKACEDYIPIGELAIDEYIDDKVEHDRIAFRAEWLKYIEAWSN